MLLIRGAKILTMADQNYESGDLLVDDQGKIAAIGIKLDAPAGAEIIEAAGMMMTPGFIDAHCHIGMEEEVVGSVGDDVNDCTDPSTPHLRAMDAVNPQDEAFRMAREHGVTTVCTGPGSANVLGGDFVALKTAGNTIEEMILRQPLALKAAFGENPKRAYGGQGKMPSTRMGTAMVFRKAMVEAQNYKRKLELGEKDPDKMPDRDLRHEALLPVLSRELPLKVHCHRRDDIMTAIRLCKEFNLRYTLDHCTEGYLMADILRQENVGIIIGPLMTFRSKIELANLSMKAPAALAKAGVKFAMMTDHPVLPLYYLPVYAALAVREGLDEDTAMKSITIHAAEICGLHDRVGSLEVGKDADLALFDGSPLDARSHTLCVVVSGKVVYRRDAV